MATTAWFADTISSFCAEYEIVCPYRYCVAHCFNFIELRCSIISRCIGVRHTPVLCCAIVVAVDKQLCYCLQCLVSTAPVTHQAATYHPRADITSTSYHQSLLLLCVILHCCHSHLGCRHICQRNELELHLVRGCQFNKEPSHATYTQVDTSQYEVMCPNAVLGCDVSCSRKDLQAHLEGACKFCGPGPKEAMAERARDLQV
jgi:hypothetical protein